MDRYLFRAKRLDNGEWACGLLTKMWGCLYIQDQEDDNTVHELDTSTIGQYIRLKDKGGKKIFEGDIFRTHLGVAAIVKWEKEGRFLGFTHDRQIVYINREPAVEVIGNIHDNPELLQEVKNNDISS